MSIVLNENEWALEMIQSCSLGKKPSETLTRVARYYIDSQYKKKDVRQMLESFILRCDPTASLVKWSDTIDYAITRAQKYPAIIIDKIEISKSEMAKVMSLGSKQSQRLAFTLLCLAKYWDAVSPGGDHWVNSKDSDIMRMANINTSVRRQGYIYHELSENGLIGFSRRVDNTNVRVQFIESGECVMTVTDLRNLGYQFNRYVGGNEYFVCQNCGITSKLSSPNPKAGRRVGRPQKYCRDCAAEIKIKQSVNPVMKRVETQW